MNRQLKRLAICAVLMLTGGALSAGAQPDRDDQVDRLQAVSKQLEQARHRAEALGRERQALEAETAAVSEKLVGLAGSIQSREARISAGEAKLKSLALKRATLRSQLRSRRRALSELLAGLQKLQRNPPPPLVVRPDDAAAAVRGGMLFGAVVPDLKGQAARLARELAELDAVRQRIVVVRRELDGHVASLAPAREELEALLLRKRALLEQTSAQLDKERRRAEALARKAKDIRQLIAQLAEERRKALQAEAARRLAEAMAAKKAADQAAQRAHAQAEAEARARAIAEAERLRKQAEAKRIEALKTGPRSVVQVRPDQPPVRFAKSKGRLQLPVHGEQVRQFGEKDGFGGQSEGLFIATRKSAQITTPADGKIEFAGRFRSYGKLVIINAGDGFHLLLAGMERISVLPGQDVAAGEPVGQMGEVPARGTLIGDRIDDPRPILYVEVRKGSSAIDSAAWWAVARQKAASRRINDGNEG